MNVLVIQTAFLGDVILTTPLIDAVRAAGSLVNVDVLVTPAGSQALAGHPSIRRILIYDKNGQERGFRSFFRLVRKIRSYGYDVAIIPHRSLRSGLLAALARVPRRVGFDRSAARRWLTDAVPYRGDVHEVERNLSLLSPLTIARPVSTRPRLAPSAEDERAVRVFLAEVGIEPGNYLTVAPGSVWNTKRWPWERYAESVRLFERRGIPAILVGGADDGDLCRRVLQQAGTERSASAAGRLTVMQSAVLIEWSAALLTNDSAPLHLGSAMGTPVIALFGATSPSFGFGPTGPDDRVIETSGLSCRPCAAHGGAVCPTGTFDCMLRIDAEKVVMTVLEVLQKRRSR